MIEAFVEDYLCSNNYGEKDETGISVAFFYFDLALFV